MSHAGTKTSEARAWRGVVVKLKWLIRRMRPVMKRKGWMSAREIGRELGVSSIKVASNIRSKGRGIIERKRIHKLKGWHRIGYLCTYRWVEEDDQV